MSFADITISRHIMLDRQDRINEIRNNGGLGEPKCWLDSREDKHIVHIMTTTNVILVCDKITRTCLTLYTASKKQLKVFAKYGINF